jgi:hypothetical protein
MLVTVKLVPPKENVVPEPECGVVAIRQLSCQRMS